MTWLIPAGQLGALAVFYAAPLVPFGALGALAFVGLAAIRLDVALAIALAMAPFFLPNESNPLPPRPIGFDGWSLTLVEFTILASTVACVLRLAWSGWPARRTSAGGLGAVGLVQQIVDWLSPAAVAFAAVATVSLLTTVHLKYAVREYRTVVLEPLIFYAMLLVVFRRRPAGLGAVYAGIGAGVALIALAHYSLVGIVESTGGVRRVLAIYHSPNALALFLERPLALAAVVGMLIPDRRRWLWLTAAVLMGAVLVLTYSRGAWAAVAAGLLFAMAIQGGRRLLAAAAAVAAGAVGLLAWLRVDRLVDVATAGRRVDVWLSALAMVRDHPLTGIGLDNFLYYYRDHYLRPAAAVEPNLSHPHNLLLDWWLRLGLLGPVVLGWLVVTVFRDGFQAWRSGLSTDERAIALGAMAAMVAGLAHGFVDNSFFLVDLAISFWVIYALTRLLCRQHPAQGDR